MTRPRVAPDVLASITGSAPSRLVKKLDRSPAMASAWGWSQDAGAPGTWRVATDSGETVTLRTLGDVVTSADQVRCTCLLSPRCLHVLATLASMPVHDEAPRGPRQGEAEALDEPSIEVSGAAQRAAARLFRAGTLLLDGGALAAGAVMQAELLRAIHECRTRGLHRAAAAGLRVIRGVRELREEKPEFALEELSMDLLVCLETSWRLTDVGAGRPVEDWWIGAARRSYRDAAGMQALGIFSEPVIARSGYAGVVTYLCDRKGSIVTVGDVIPGEPARAAAAYDASLRIGEATLSHRALSRRGLYLQNATLSPDGRLGSGADVRAVARGASSWGDEELKTLWGTPLADQIGRARETLALPVTERPAGADLVFVRGCVVGLTSEGIVLSVQPAEGSAPIALSARAPSDHEALSYRGNLRQLGRAPGLELLAIGRVRLSRPRTIDLLAVGPAPVRLDDPKAEVPSLRIPSEWGGRVNLGFDALQGAHISGGRREGPEVELQGSTAPDPLAPLRRRIHRLVLGGRLTIPPSAVRTMSKEADALDEAMMTNAAALIRDLGDAASSAERTIRGTRSAGEPERLSLSWLGAAVYEQAATLALHAESWL